MEFLDLTSVNDLILSKTFDNGKVDYLAEKAFEDQCTTANPKLPLVSELAEIYKKAYKGV